MNSPLPDEELAEIRQRCDAATPGPWRSMAEGRDHTSGDSFIMVGRGNNRGDDIYVTVGRRPAPVADLDFIAAARLDVPRLLDEIMRLRLGKEGTE
jgi:hypothetical protein